MNTYRYLRSTRYQHADESTDESSLSDHQFDTSGPESDNEAGETSSSDCVIQISDNEAVSENETNSIPLETIEDPLDPMPRNLGSSSSVVSDAQAKATRGGHGRQNEQKKPCRSFVKSRPENNKVNVVSDDCRRLQCHENTEEHTAEELSAHDTPLPSSPPENRVQQAEASGAPSTPECYYCKKPTDFHQFCNAVSRVFTFWFGLLHFIWLIALPGLEELLHGMNTSGAALLCADGDGTMAWIWIKLIPNLLVAGMFALVAFGYPLPRCHFQKRYERHAAMGEGELDDRTKQSLQDDCEKIHCGILGWRKIVVVVTVFVVVFGSSKGRMKDICLYVDPVAAKMQEMTTAHNATLDR